MIETVYSPAFIGTLLTLLAAWGVHVLGRRYIVRHTADPRARYSRRKLLHTVLLAATVVVLILLWSSRFPNTGTFLGLMGAGLAVALREPLLAVVGRIAILAGRTYNVGDRIQIEKVKGDVIDVGFVYTRMMEIGNWIDGDQASGRTVQFSNSKVFSGPIFNYTNHLEYVWDEIRVPITYGSDLQAMNDVLISVAGAYTEEFLEGAEAELEKMGRTFLVPVVETRPKVFVRVTDNWLECSLRYVVDAKKRRDATDFIFRKVFAEVRKRDDIQLASETMDVTARTPKEEG